MKGGESLCNRRISCFLGLLTESNCSGVVERLEIDVHINKDEKLKDHAIMLDGVL